MDEIVEKLEKLTSLTGIDFIGKASSYPRVLEGLPDSEGAITRLSLLVSQILSRQFPEKVKGKSNLLLQSYFSEEIFKQVAVLFSNSPILSHYLSKDSETFLDLFPIVKCSVKEYQLKQKELLSRLLSGFNSSGEGRERGAELISLYREIRKAKVREFITISLADYLGLDTFEETVAKISLFAETTVAYALEFSGLAQLPVAVIAMGKLGGQELNYNSDIDVMFVAADQIKEETDSRSFITKIHYFIDVLDKLTSDGFVFKVDLRIRPEGDQGPLCLKLKQYERYYQNRAESWEFQALIKARTVGGNMEVGKKFEEFRKKFVFNPDFSSKKMLFSIARIKNTIESFHDSHGYNNVKLSPGGIRDLEFTVQFLQIHHGKITKVLNSSNSLSTLDKLLAYNLITSTEHRDFKENYCFLRRVEHYLQLVGLQPVREIPNDAHRLQIISKMLGYQESTQFREKVKKVMDYNRNLFIRIFKLTVIFYEKIENIRIQMKSEVEGDEKIYFNFFESHLGHLESDYYLNFDTPIIIEHFKLLKDLIENRSHLELSINLKHSDIGDNGKIWVSLVTSDYFGLFSLICAVFSGNGINIQNGASFLYQPDDMTSDSPLSKGIPSQYRPGNSKAISNISSKRVFSSRLSKSNLSGEIRETSSKKVMFFMEGFFINRKFEKTFNEQHFRETFQEIILQVKKGKYDEVMEGLLLKSIKSVGRNELESSEKKLKPINMWVDNESHPLYTLVDIESEDSFLFLFSFTYALSYKGYYIIKVEFSTLKNKVCNRIFLTDKKKRKVLSPSSILELKSSILIVKYFSTFMTHSPNPSLAYKTFNRLIKNVNPMELGYQDYHGLFRDLAKVLGTGEVIMEDFLRLQHGDIQSLLSDKKEINIPFTVEYLEKKISEIFANSKEDPVDALNEFKDAYLFQLDLRLLTGATASFGNFCREMSCLTDVVMSQAVGIAINKSLEKFFDTFSKKEPGRHVLIALGKWGSQEMGYASDVELVFVYDGPRGNDNKILPSVKEFYVYLGNQIAKIIRSKKNGVFELDFRLRPGGDEGTIAVSLDRYQSYYSEGGGYLNYERMVLSRLRIVSDSGDLGKNILAVQKHFVYELGDFNFDDFFSLRKKQIDNLVHPKDKKPSYRSQVAHIKFSPGGLVELEYLLQIFAIHYGKDNPRLHKNNTLDLAQTLLEEKLIDKKTYQEIVESYKFLRNLINCIRIIRGNAKDMLVPERNSLEMEYLKRTMVNLHTLEKEKDLFEVIQRVMNRVHQLYNNLLANLKNLLDNKLKTTPKQ